MGIPGLDVDGLARWLAVARPDLVGDSDSDSEGDPGPPVLRATQLTGGRSNLTYRVDGARTPLVLRRPPLGHVLASAHDMRREHRVVRALADSAVPTPEAVGFCDDSVDGAVTGTPFFVMELVPGRVLLDRAQNGEFTARGLRALSVDLAEGLARLHAIDPVAIGLGDLGQPDGYLARQLGTWRRQYAASRSRDLPALDALQEALGAHLPQSPSRPVLVHGDYRLDNALVTGDGDSPRITAILDWEMSTLGDPLVDLGMLALYWDVAALPEGVAGLWRSAVDPAAGYLGVEEVVDAYAAHLGTRVPTLSWYRAFASYKLAVIIEQIHYRHRSGGTVGGDVEGIGALVEPLARDGLTRVTRTQE